MFYILKEDGDVLFSELYNSFGNAKNGIENFLTDFALKRGKKIVYLSKEELEKLRNSPKKLEDVYYIRKKSTEAVIYQRKTTEGYFLNSYYLSKIGKVGLNEFCVKIHSTNTEDKSMEDKNVEDKGMKDKNVEDKDIITENKDLEKKDTITENKDAEKKEIGIEKKETNIESSSPVEEKVKASHVTNYERGLHVSLISEMKKKLGEKKDIKFEEKEIQLQELKKQKKESFNLKNMKFIESLEKGKQSLKHVEIPDTGKSYNLIPLKNKKNIKITDEQLVQGKLNLKKVERVEPNISEIVKEIIETM